MRNCSIILFLAMVLVAGCQKEISVEKSLLKVQSPGSPERRLLSVVDQTSGGAAFTDSFSYDAEGRVISFLEKFDNSPVLKIADVTYEGNRMIIQYTSNNFLPGRIEFVLNAADQPVLRYLLFYIDTSSQNFNLSDYYRDTIEYSYENGYLKKTTLRGLDSKLSSANGVQQNTFIKSESTTNFDVENGVLLASHEDYHQTLIDEKGSAVTTTASGYKGEMRFNYSRRYPNNLIKNNQLALRTFYAYSFLPLIPFSEYQMIPDQTDISWNDFDSTGNSIGNKQFNNAVRLEYNEKGLFRCYMNDGPVDHTVEYHFE